MFQSLALRCLNYGWGRFGGLAPFPDLSKFKAAICILLTPFGMYVENSNIKAAVAA